MQQLSLTAPPPVMPSEGTDSYRLLRALMMGPVWNPNSSLNLMAHSRASDLRKLGWSVTVERRRIPGSRKKNMLYRLDTPQSEWPD